jgi:DNA ligase (NAD+)
MRLLIRTRFLHALSIPHVGAETARLISQDFQTLKNVRTATKEALAEITGVGDVVAESVVDFFAADDNQDFVDRLLKQVNVTKMLMSDINILLIRTRF